MNSAEGWKQKVLVNKESDRTFCIDPLMDFLIMNVDWDI